MKPLLDLILRPAIVAAVVLALSYATLGFPGMFLYAVTVAAVHGEGALVSGGPQDAVWLSGWYVSAAMSAAILPVAVALSLLAPKLTGWRRWTAVVLLVLAVGVAASLWLHRAPPAV